MSDEPIDDNELESLFSDFLKFNRLLLAVSGGRDSVALLVLAARWRLLRTEADVFCPELHAVTVDHGLRAQARAEVEFVAQQCGMLGIPHLAYRIADTAPDKGVQDWARQVRYAALTETAHKLGCGAIVTGHQAEDQAETVLMRLARGSGLNGLAAMSPSRRHEDLDLLRPLLSVSRNRLSATLRASGVEWIDDPSNVDPRFERSAYHVHAASLEALGLTPDALGVSARRLRDAALALDWAVDQALEQMPTCSDALETAAYGDLPRGTFEALPFGLRVRVLQFVLHGVSGDTRPVRLDRLEALVRDLARPDARNRAKFTLGGCLITVNEQTLRIFREPGRAGFPVLDLEAGGSGCWDNRFVVSAPSDFEGKISIRALSDPPGGASVTLAPEELQQLPKAALAAIPAFWRGKTLLAVPQTGLVAAGYRIKTTMDADRDDPALREAMGVSRTFVSYPVPVQRASNTSNRG